MQLLDPHLLGPDNRCFGCAPHHPIGFHLQCYKTDELVTTRFTPDERYQGPPGVMHGGLVTTLADEVAAWTVLGLLSKFGFTARLAAKLKKPVRVGTEIVVNGTITRNTSRIVEVAITMTQEELEVFSGEFTFAVLDRAGAEKLLGSELSERWSELAR